MKTIVVTSGKGGTGKSSLSMTLAVRAAEDNPRVAMIDLNSDQASLTQWWTLRGRPVNPYLMEDRGKLSEDIALLRADNWQICIVDTGPGDIDAIEFAILVADLVLIPVRPAFVDIAAVDAITDICKRRRKAYAFVLNAFDPRAIFKSVNNEATAFLEGRGHTLKTPLPYAPGFISGQSRGKVAFEMDKKLREPVDDVWSEINEMLAAKASPVLVRGRS